MDMVLDTFLHFLHGYHMSILGVFIGTVTVFVSLHAVRLLLAVRANLHLIATFPGPPSHWLFGHLLELNPESQMLHKMHTWSLDYSGAYRVRFGIRFFSLTITNPSYIRTVLTLPGPKNQVDYQFLDPWIDERPRDSLDLLLTLSSLNVVYSHPSTPRTSLLGQGLLTLPPAPWYPRRRLFTPAFHYNILKDYAQLIAHSVYQLLDKWDQKVGPGAVFDVYEDLSLLTLDSLMRCAFSRQPHCQTKRTNEYVRAVKLLTDLLTVRVTTLYYHNSLLFFLSLPGYRFRKACRLVHNYTDDVIRERQRELAAMQSPGRVNGGQEVDGNEQMKTNKRLDFLDILLAAQDKDGRPLPDDAIRAEVDTFMFACHDTTATALAWCLVTLAQYPEHQEQCRTEAQNVISSSSFSSSPDWSELAKQPYITMCVRECMRLFPPVPRIGRLLDKSITFLDGREVPKGTAIGINIFSLHLNPEFWDRPEEFDPLRFSPDNSAGRHSHAYLPFSAGPRNCIGQQFAMLEVRIALLLILTRFRIAPSVEHPTPCPVPRVVLRSLTGFHLHLSPIAKG